MHMYSLVIIVVRSTVSIAIAYLPQDVGKSMCCHGNILGGYCRIDIHD